MIKGILHFSYWANRSVQVCPTTGPYSAILIGVVGKPLAGCKPSRSCQDFLFNIDMRKYIFSAAIILALPALKKTLVFSFTI